MNKRIGVLVIDDSALVRKVLTEVLNQDPDIEVIGSAQDPLFAFERLKTLSPAVITLDIEMPRMDGVTFLRELMAKRPLPVIVCSSLVGAGTDVAIRALEAGAVELIEKPQIGVKDFLAESALRLRDSVKAAAQARLRPARAQGGPRPERLALPSTPVSPFLTTDKVIAIGASTGGTEAIREVLEVLPPDLPGIVIVQHMPAGFTAAFAKRLDGLSHIEVREARDGDRVIPGVALIAPGDRHLQLTRNGAQYAVRVGGGPLVSRHRPSVDVLMRSVAKSAGRNAVGVLLTGMGADGAEGLLEMRRAGAHTIAQDEESCVVYGMPKEAVRAGAAVEVLSLDDIPARLLALKAGVPHEKRPGRAAATPAR